MPLSVSPASIILCATLGADPQAPGVTCEVGRVWENREERM